MATTMRELYRSAREDLDERIADCAGDDEKRALLDEPHDVIHEIADANVPVMTHELMLMAADDIDLATAEPELGPAFDGSPTPVNIIAANVYEALSNNLFEYVGELLEAVPA